MSGVQTEAIAALAASGAAVFGVPAALLVGFRQARAARHAAELTARAAHSQARKSARRDAAVVFVLAAESALDECMRMHGSKDPIERYLQAIEKRVLGEALRACTVIRIEGPEQLAQKAQQVISTLSDLTMRVARRQRTAHAWHRLQEAAEGSDTISAALGELTAAFGPEDPRVGEAWQTIAGTGILTPDLVSPLRTHLHIGGPRPGVKPVGMLEARERVRKALAGFIDATRKHLDETAPWIET